MHMALTRCTAHALSKFQQEAFIVYGMYGVKTQAVHAIVKNPHERVFTEEIAHWRLTKVDARAPRRVYIFAEELFGILAEIIAIGAEMVIDDIHKHHQTQTVGGIYEAF